MTKKIMPPKTSSSFRLSDDAKRLLSALADKMGLSLTAALEVMIREFAETKGVK